MEFLYCPTSPGGKLGGGMREVGFILFKIGILFNLFNQVFYCEPRGNIYQCTHQLYSVWKTKLFLDISLAIAVPERFLFLVLN